MTKKQAVANVNQNFKNQIVGHVRSVTLGKQFTYSLPHMWYLNQSNYIVTVIQIVEHVNVIWMAQMDTIVNRLTECVHAKSKRQEI